VEVKNHTHSWIYKDVMGLAFLHLQTMAPFSDLEA
jgi:hypothetical protein